MTKRRLLRWSLILVILAAFAVWLEPTRVVWGWLRGEAFYQGRPTSWWSREFQAWRPRNKNDVVIGLGGSIAMPREKWARDPNFLDRCLTKSRRSWTKYSAYPPIYNDPAATGVLEELLTDSVAQVREMAQEGLKWINVCELNRQ